LGLLADIEYLAQQVEQSHRENTSHERVSGRDHAHGGCRSTEYVSIHLFENVHQKSVELWQKTEREKHRKSKQKESRN